MIRKQGSYSHGALVAGVILIGIGTVMLLDRVTHLDIGDVVRNYWPSFIILLGIPNLFERKTVWNGLWMIVIGAWLQAVTLHLYGLTYRNSWPLLLIVHGGGLILRALFEAVSPKEERHEQ
ncbi:MAG TPA: DUF5668 domain-containing protein [Thermoanaerobaculia bacterium]|nr:DUF5668 domain-containing protein [Thermoanaerobaculia bacterium]